ncbi:trans-sulfuration enzyme family protein [Rhizobium alvei]|uniref:Aminotransferase class I/II-fold pyridoxal phosphate-dependent enzyme n=1 Tax=Rhizobium alvei TaxID=1132659 RepID=A0ABT8YLW0_9HYPH|nr:aminotransferase class I/II-fold pyridoxal phosphate-dependent enzyme [Rhizobium alvei]MDO6964328.1 aminotransferase class I/II-fold pyridoxal phosphate-dependent enzyme [Rhizobium alvei]
MSGDGPDKGSTGVVANRNAGWRPETQAVDAGLVIDPLTRSIAPNLSFSVNNVVVPGEGAFSAAGVDDLADLPYLYARWTNPTVRQLEQRVAALEQTEEALASATGMAAAAGVFFTFLKAGDHLIVSDVCYAGVAELTRSILPDYGIEVSVVNMSRIDAVEKAIRPNTRLIHCESPCNPLMRLTDIAAVSALARSRSILVSVDSTFATPVATRPASLGADLVIHSLTKFMNGHGDALGGIVCGSKALIARIRARTGVYFGAALSAHSAWLIMRGIDTLYPRMRMVSDSALKVARFLESHPKVGRVIYPGLESHPQRDLAARQMEISGGMISFQVKERAKDHAMAMANNLKVVHYAFSLGHQRSLVVLLDTDEMIASTFRLTGEDLDDYRAWAGDGTFRLSIGLEHVDDLIADLDQALNSVA